MDGYGLDKRVLKVFIDCNVLFSRAIICFQPGPHRCELTLVHVVDSDVPITLRHGVTVYIRLSYRGCRGTSDFSPSTCRIVDLIVISVLHRLGMRLKSDHADPLLPRNAARNDARLQASARFGCHTDVFTAPTNPTFRTKKCLPWRICE